MSISQGLYTNQDLILVNFAAGDRYQVLRELGKRALEKGFIAEGFIEGLLEREEEFPTGLETEVPVAIPHLGEFCHKPFFSAATLNQPVVFYAMDGSGKELQVEIVFLFGIPNPSDQVQVLKRFIAAFQDGESLQRLKRVEDPAKALSLLNSILADCLIVGREGGILHGHQDSGSLRRRDFYHYRGYRPGQGNS